MTSRDAIRWSGFIGNDQADLPLQNLKDGDYEFAFKATYTNGVIKKDLVIVKIRGNWTEFYRLHQSW